MWGNNNKDKKKRTKKALKACDGSLLEMQKLLRYTKADQSLLAGKEYGGLLDKETIMESIAIYIIEKEFLDGECEEHILD